MRPGWADTIWSIEVMTLGLVSEGFLIDPLEHLPLVLHGLLWYFPNKQVTGGGSGGLILLSFIGNTPFLDSLRRDLKGQWFSLCCQTRSSLSSRTRSSYVEHSFAISSLVISAPIAYFSPPPGWWGFYMGSWLELGGLLLPPGSCLDQNLDFIGVSPGSLLGALL